MQNKTEPQPGNGHSSQSGNGQSKYWYEIFEPPNQLISKVSTGTGMTPQEMLAKAHAVVDALHDEFAAMLHQAIEQLGELECRLAAGRDDVGALMRQLFRVSHEIKGQGKTFGFDLVSYIAESLCALLDRVDHGHPKLIQSLKTHIDALRLVSSRRIYGDGGELGTELIKSLWQEVEVVGGAAPPPPKLSGGNRDG